MNRYIYKIILGLLIVGIALSCTIAVVGSDVYGRPIMWKNRDVSNQNQEIRYFEGENYDFIANLYYGDVGRVWAGINSAGFGILNTDTYNQGPWIGVGPDDGQVMYYALGHFSHISDFQQYLDSTNISGRSSTHCYGVFDETGAAAVFEAGCNDYIRYDAESGSRSILIRTNYADCGSTLSRVGVERRQRARELISIVPTIDPGLLMFSLARDLATEELYPYPLPFEGIYNSYPEGVISTHHTINRYYTSSASILVGSGSDGTPAMMWEFLGQPIVSLALPLWVQAGSVPSELYGSSGSELCEMACYLKDLVYTSALTIDTYALYDILSFYRSWEYGIYNDIQDLYSGDSGILFNPTQLESLQNDIAYHALERYNSFLSLYVKEGWGNVPKEIELKAYPNPMNSCGNLEFNLPAFGNAEIKLYNINGKLISTPYPIKYTRAGKINVLLDMEGLPSGVYLAKLLTDGSLEDSQTIYLIK